MFTLTLTVQPSPMAQSRCFRAGFFGITILPSAIPPGKPLRFHSFRPCHGPQFPGKPLTAPADEQIHKKHLF